MTSNQQAALEWLPVACHRMVTGDPPTKWQWISGPASLGEMDRAKLYGWTIENAFVLPERGEHTGDTPTFIETWAKLTTRDRAIISAYFMEASRRPTPPDSGEK